MQDCYGVGQHCCYEYDRAGRLTYILLPDQSKIYYAYHGPLLIALVRHSPTGEELYRHVYDPESFDMYQQPTKQIFLKNAGTITNSFDIKGRFHSCISAHTSEVVPVDGL